jgi:hypothetical protein
MRNILLSFLILETLNSEPALIYRCFTLSQTQTKWLCKYSIGQIYGISAGSEFRVSRIRKLSRIFLIGNPLCSLLVADAFEDLFLIQLEFHVVTERWRKNYFKRVLIATVKSGQV